MAAPPGLDASQILSWKGRGVHNTDLVGSVHIGASSMPLQTPVPTQQVAIQTDYPLSVRNYARSRTTIGNKTETLGPGALPSGYEGQVSRGYAEPQEM